MHRKALLFAISVAAVAFNGCAVSPHKTAQPSGKPDDTHADIAYTQFILTAGSGNKEPYDLSSLGMVAAQCNGTFAPPRAGGAAGTALSLVDELLGKLVSTALQTLEKWVGKEVAKYSVSMSGKEVRYGFYDPALWFKQADGAKYSCFVIVVSRCSPSHVDRTTEMCVHTPGSSPQAVIIGQYRLTPEYLQVRPLYGYVTGFAAKRNSASKASIAATLKLSSVWWDGVEGHTETPITASVLTQTFTPNASGIDLPVQHKTKAGYAFTDWNSEPLIQRPPRTRHTLGTIGVTPTVAEANSPPKGLELIQKVLKNNASAISSALNSALTALNPKK